MGNIRSVGRPRLNIDEGTLLLEIEKYKNGQQSGVQTFRNLKIGKTSFYRLLNQMNVKRN